MTVSTTDQAMAYLAAQHASGTLRWKAACLMLQRIARNLPAVYPTALSAAHATPEADRVYDLAKVTRGMVAYFDDPSDSNPAGHIVGVPGRNAGGRLLTWTNDAKRTGGVDLVGADFFPREWGDAFLFGATSLNGFDLDLPGRAKPKKKPAIGKKAPNFDTLEAAFRSAIETHEARGHTELVRKLKKELRDIEATRKEFSR